ncbi:hypothetical protein [Streptomyces xanthochromogenes]
MSGTRTKIGDQLRKVKVGDEVEPGKQTVQRQSSPSNTPSIPEEPQTTGSRQIDERTNSPRIGAQLAPITVFVPPSSTDRAERLSHCVSAIREADRATELATERITQQYLIWVGEPYEIIREEKLYLLDGYDTFDAWGRALNGHGSSYMNRVIRVGPVVRALASITRRQLKEEPLRPLVSVQRDHGDDAVRECWKAAEKAGDLTGRGLLAAAIKCGYKVNLEPVEERTETAPQALEPSKILNVGKLKRLGATDPAQALALCRELQENLATLEKELMQS